MIKVYIDRDVEKSHGISINLGFNNRVGRMDYGLCFGLQWRGYQPNDDGQDPWMLYLSVGRFFINKKNLFCHRQRTFVIIKPIEQISYTSRLSLALHGKKYSCDDYGAEQSIWQFRMRNKK